MRNTTRYRLKIKALFSPELRGGPEQQTTQIYSYEPDYSVKEKVAKKGSCRDTGLWVTLRWWGSAPITRSHLLNILMEGHQFLTPHFPLHKTYSICLAYSYMRQFIRNIAHNTGHSHIRHTHTAHTHTAPVHRASLSSGGVQLLWRDLCQPMTDGS